MIARPYVSSISNRFSESDRVVRQHHEEGVLFLENLLNYMTCENKDLMSLILPKGHMTERACSKFGLKAVVNYILLSEHEHMKFGCLGIILTSCLIAYERHIPFRLAFENVKVRRPPQQGAFVLSLILNYNPEILL
jgi:hypothetical protein